MDRSRSRASLLPSSSPSIPLESIAFTTPRSKPPAHPAAAPSSVSSEGSRPGSKKSGLPEATERALLKHLVSPFRFNKFSQICKQQPLLWSEDPKQRKQIRNRKEYLESLPCRQFLKVCVDQGVKPSDNQIFESEEDDDEEDLNDSEESDLQSPQVQRSPQVLRSLRVQ
jgi:hypothetical protein